MTIEELALEFHQDHDGDIGCKGMTCPAVARVVTFADKCVAMGMANQQQRIREIVLLWRGRNSYTKYTPEGATKAISELLADISAVVEPEALEYFRRPLTVKDSVIAGRPSRERSPLR